MGKIGKLVLKILYFVVTFGFGIFLALTLPSYFQYYDAPLGNIKENLESSNYDEAMSVVGGYYNADCIFNEQFSDKSGIVLFEATTLETIDDKEATILNKTYAGFIYGLSSYETVKNANNQTKIVLYDLSSNEYDVNILDFDSDDDGTKDSISTLVDKNFIYLDFPLKTYGSISKLEFIDRDGNIFKTINLNLDYSGAFFTDVDEFLTEYNTNPTSDRFSALDEEFRSKSSSYKMSSTQEYRDEAIKKSTIAVVIYFALIYMFYDLAIGRRYIIKGFKWILEKVFKVKPKQKNYNFGYDYMSKVTISLDLTECENFNKPVLVKYSKQDYTVEFNLLFENNYQLTKSIKAGLYLNPWIELDKDYYALDLPENLVVDGYKKDFVIKIKKSERNDR